MNWPFHYLALHLGASLVTALDSPDRPHVGQAGPWHLILALREYLHPGNAQVTTRRGLAIPRFGARHGRQLSLPLTQRGATR